MTAYIVATVMILDRLGLPWRPFNILAAKPMRAGDAGFEMRLLVD